MSVIHKKKLLRIIVAGIVLGTPAAFAGFEVVHEGAEPKPLTPVQVITEAHENARLRSELKHLSAELSKVEAELKYARNDVTRSRQALSALQSKLNLLQADVDKIVVSFAFGNTEFVPEPGVAAHLLASAKSASVVNVRGYTDSVGVLSVNQRVASQRANTARSYLVKRGVDGAKIRADGRTGEYIASNATQAGRLANRRVEIEFEP